MYSGNEEINAGLMTDYAAVSNEFHKTIFFHYCPTKK